MRNIVMGKTSMKRSVAVLAMAAAVLPLHAQQLLRYTDSVRYNYTDNLNGIAWTSRTYSDTGGNWASGQAVLSTDGTLAGVTVRTPLPDPRGFTPAGHPVYFRAHFTYSGPATAVLTLTNRVDDGAVFYLNGVELPTRIRVSAGAVTFASFANATPPGGDADADDLLTFTVNNLVNGDNVLAVMVLQNGNGSSDVSYGTEMAVVSPVSITQQPQSQTVPANNPVSFSVTATGASPRYQWQFNSANISGATNDTYTIANAQTGNAGSYRVIVSNPVNSVTSSVATLTVTSDNAPPELVSALASETTNFITITFDERVLNTSATNEANYTVREIGSTNMLEVFRAQVNANLVRLTVEPWRLGSNYVVTVSNVSDIVGNIIVPGSSIGVGFWQDLISRPDVPWNWQWIANLDGQNWKALSYNEYTNSWEQPPYNGPWITSGDLAGFYYDNDSDLNYTWPVNTVLNQGFPTYYFRKRFTLPTNASSTAILSLTNLIDDGGVVYLNGVEIYRYNMPAGTPTYDTLASSQRGTTVLPVYSGDIQVTNLVGGTNVVAAELHPFTLTGQNEPGLYFGLTLRGAFTPKSTPPPPELAVTASATPSAVGVNSNYTFTFVVNNRSPSASTANVVQATSALPPGVTVVGSLPAGCNNNAGTITCAIGSLPGGQSVSRAITLSASTAGSKTNQVTVGSTPADSISTNNQAQAVVVVSGVSAPDIAVTASATPLSVAVSSNYTFTFVVTNTGSSTATSVQSTNALPTGVTTVSLPNGCSVVSGSVVCSIGSLNAGQAATRTLTLKAGSAGSLTNRVVVGSTPADANLSNNSATNVVTALAQPAITNVTLTGGNISFRIACQAGVSYVTEYKSVLNAPAWIPVATNGCTGGILTITPPNPGPSVPTRFYRVRAQ